MKVLNLRYNSAPEHTNGLLHIDGRFMCYTLEDQHQAVKVPGETRIPDGIYRLGLRTVGGFHNRYLAKYGPDFHKGMIEVLNVPGFKYILLHAGNTDKDTAGCLLLGMTQANGDNFIGDSVKAYKKVYPVIVEALLAGAIVEIEYLTVGVQI